MLLYLNEGSVATLTARRSMMRPIDQYLNMCALLGTEPHAQRVTLTLQPSAHDAQILFHHLRLVPGEYVEQSELERLSALARQVDVQFREGALA